MTRTKKQCMMWALVVRMNGMIQENHHSQMRGSIGDYNENHFEQLAQELEVLSNEPEEP